MKSLPWLRLYTEIIDDEKLGLLAFEDRWHFVAILCLKGKGILDTEADPEMLARKIALKMGLTVQELEKVVHRLARMKLVDPVTFQPNAWDNRQMQSDTSTDRVKAYRERTKQVKREGNVSETAQDTDTDTDTEVDKEKEVKTTIEQKSADASPMDDGFDLFWKAGMVKTGRKKALSLFAGIVKRTKADPAELGARLAADVAERIRVQQFGFDKLHPSTYLTQERWTDEVRTAVALVPNGGFNKSKQQQLEDRNAQAIADYYAGRA